MEWFARLFRVRTAPPPSLRGVLAGCLCAALLLTTTACGGTTKSASTAIQGLDDIIRAVACGKILDQIAPDERPTEPGAATPTERATREAVDKLAARRWATASLIVNWDYYLESVLEGATQFAQGVDGLSTTYIAALGNPGVPKAVVVYLRTCYTSPKPFPSR